MTFQMKFMISAILISLFYYKLSNCEICERKTISFRNNVLKCKNITDQFPNNNTYDTTNIVCENCNIPIFTEKTISKFNGDHFDISNSNVEKIMDNAFNNFSDRVRKLTFANNKIVYIASHVFDKFKNLEEINFRNNSLKEIENGLFNDVTIGSLLDFSSNEIVDPKNFVKKIKVLKLDLSKNKITEITPNTFNETSFWTSVRYKSNLIELDLSYNEIVVIYPNGFTFDKDSSLKNLNLKNNKMISIVNNTFLNLNDLRTLNVESNLIEIIEAGSFSKLGNLMSLSLAENKLQNLPLDTFSNLQRLEILNLESNLLTSLQPSLFSGLMKLYKLYLAHNKLKKLEPSTIFLLGKLSYLDISDNRLRHLDLKSIFEHQNLIKTLIINDNFWTCSELVEMYKMMNQKTGGFSSAAKHFDVPNLHGIACSRGSIDFMDDDLTFDKFMNFISQDRVFEDIYDTRITNKENSQDIIILNKLLFRINGIFWLLLIVTLMMIVYFFHFVYLRFKSNKIIATKLNFRYSKTEQDNESFM